MTAKQQWLVSLKNAEFWYYIIWDYYSYYAILSGQQAVVISFSGFDMFVGRDSKLFALAHSHFYFASLHLPVVVSL